MWIKNALLSFWCCSQDDKNKSADLEKLKDLSKLSYNEKSESSDLEKYNVEAKQLEFVSKRSIEKALVPRPVISLLKRTLDVFVQVPLQKWANETIAELILAKPLELFEKCSNKTTEFPVPSNKREGFESVCRIQKKEMGDLLVELIRKAWFGLDSDARQRLWIQFKDCEYMGLAQKKQLLQAGEVQLDFDEFVFCTIRSVALSYGILPTEEVNTLSGHQLELIETQLSQLEEAGHLMGLQKEACKDIYGEIVDVADQIGIRRLENLLSINRDGPICWDQISERLSLLLVDAGNFKSQRKIVKDFLIKLENRLEDFDSPSRKVILESIHTSVLRAIVGCVEDKKEEAQTRAEVLQKEIKCVLKERFEVCEQAIRDFADQVVEICNDEEIDLNGYDEEFPSVCYQYIDAKKLIDLCDIRRLNFTDGKKQSVLEIDSEPFHDSENRFGEYLREQESSLKNLRKINHIFETHLPIYKQVFDAFGIAVPAVDEATKHV